MAPKRHEEDAPERESPPLRHEGEPARPLEYAPPGSVEWNAEAWRPSDSPRSPTRTGAPEREPGKTERR